ncbi:sensor histidine kinase [Corynebacterium sp. H130]|uniref:sensor histidine kinase n=1 Tax=Corynebacterium sp. H130 TaxID=3133444 RepID=UPI0030A58957
MARHSFHNSVIDPKLFDAFFYITIALYLRVFGFVEDTLGWVLSIGALLVMIVMWHRWRRAPFSSPVSAFLFTVASTVGFILIGNLIGIALVWLALTQLVFSLRLRWTLVYLATLSSVTFVLHAVVGANFWKGIWEASAMALLMAWGINFAMLLKRAIRLDEERAVAYSGLQRQLEQSQDLVINEERARIADTLHDGLGHKLTAVCMSLDFISKTIPSRPEKAQAEAEVARKLTSEAIDDMRKVVRAMNPIAIDNNPITTIQTLAESFSTTSLQVSFETNIDHLPEEQALLALRFSQEALTNVVRHSDATEVRMSLKSGERTTFTVHDNGAPPTATFPGFGIRSLTERALEQEATVSYDTSNGFSLTLTMPTKEAVS